MMVQTLVADPAHTIRASSSIAIAFSIQNRSFSPHLQSVFSQFETDPVRSTSDDDDDDDDDTVQVLTASLPSPASKLVPSAHYYYYYYRAVFR